MTRPDRAAATLPVLTYHSMDLTQSAHDSLTVGPRALRAQLGAFVEEGYQVVGLTEALRLSPATPAIAVTVDDGYRSNLDMLPVLQELGARATLYMVSGCLDGRAHWLDHRPEMLRVDELLAVAGAGVEIGSHGVAHLPLDELPAAALDREVQLSRTRLQEITGDQVVSFCYPHGYWNRASRTAVARAGYGNACVLGHGLHRRDGDALTVRRLLVTQRDTPQSLLRRAVSQRPTARRIVATAGAVPWRVVRRRRRERVA